MTQAAVTAHIHSFGPQPSARAQGVRGVQVAGHGPSAVQQVSELERHRLARELHGGAIHEVLAAGLAIDLCLADIAARTEEMGWILRADRSDLGGIAVRVVLPASPPGDMQGDTDG